MAYTDRELAQRMATELVSQELVSDRNLDKFRQDPDAVKRDLGVSRPGSAARYWLAVSGWLAAQGAHVASMNARSQPGRRGSYLGHHAGLYSECFGDIVVRGGADADPVAMIASHMRFIKQFG